MTVLEFEQSFFDTFSTLVPPPSQHLRIVVGVSGGRDSMVLLHLLQKTSSKLLVAHVNFGLRNQESDTEEAFVQDYCYHNRIEFKSVRFNTQQYASENGLSIQMAARKLRYEWFETLRSTFQADYIAVGTQLSDQTETLLINLNRGTGILGLKGIDRKRRYIIRPLLWAQRSDVTAYANEVGVPFKNDSSNADDKYLRNFIRNQIIDPWIQVNPRLHLAVAKTADHVSRIADFVTHSATNIFSQHLIYQSIGVKVYGEGLLNHPHFELLAWFNFQEFGFSEDQISRLATANFGASFCTNTVTIYRERNGFSVVEHANLPVHHGIDIKPMKGIDFPKALDHYNAYFDSVYKAEHWEIRAWKKGDTIIPFGRKKPKLVSDLLTNHKVAAFARSSYPVVCYQSEIVWIPGILRGNQMPLNAQSQNVLQLSVNLDEAWWNFRQV